MASRLLVTKGVEEFVQAPSSLEVAMFMPGFCLLGSRTLRTLPQFLMISSCWNDNGIVEVLGYRPDLNVLMSNSHVICLPSYYPEGLPKVLCEAAACGRSVVTTDEPGCRDSIEVDVTGLLVPSRDPLSLANAIERLVTNRDLNARMGFAGRMRAERLFDLDLIINRHLQIYNKLLSS